MNVGVKKESMKSQRWEGVMARQTNCRRTKRAREIRASTRDRSRWRYRLSCGSFIGRISRSKSEYKKDGAKVQRFLNQRKLGGAEDLGDFRWLGHGVLERPMVDRFCDLLWVGRPTYRRSSRRPTVGFFGGVRKSLVERLSEGCSESCRGHPLGGVSVARSRVGCAFVKP